MTIPDSWKISVLAAIASVVIAVIAWLAVARANLKADLAKTTAEYILCQRTNADWALKAEATNTAIKKMQDEVETRRKQATEEQKKAEREQRLHASKAKDILATKTTGDSCQAVERLVRQYLRGRT